MRSLGIATGICMALVGWTPASACSFGDEYVRPSDFELVQTADAIVVATARGPGGRDGRLGTIRFEVSERLKGGAPAAVEVYGEEAPRPRPGVIFPSYRPEGHQGDCDLRIFRKGHRYLLFLQRFPDGHMRAEHAFSRSDENYAAGGEAWLGTIRSYLAIQATAAPMEQVAILERMERTGRDPAGARLAASDLEELRFHLSSLSPYKPTPFLLAAYRAIAPAARVPGDRGEPPSAVAAATTLLAGKVEAGVPDARAEARRQILVALVNGEHPDARPLFERLAVAAPQDPSTMGLVLRYFAKNGPYARAFEWIETRLMATLPLLDPGTAKQLIADVAKAQGGEEGSERWRSDPHAAAAWPELALALYWYQLRTFGAEEALPFPDAIRSLPHADLRARPLLTLALAHDFDSGIAEWAVTELRDAARRRVWEALPAKERQGMEDPALLPLRVLIAAWTADNATVVRELYCQSEARRLLLIDTLGESADVIYGALLKDMAASDLSAEARDRLAYATLKYAARERRMIDADDVEKDLLPRIMARERLAGPGIACPVQPR